MLALFVQYVTKFLTSVMRELTCTVYKDMENTFENLTSLKLSDDFRCCNNVNVLPIR